MRCLDMYYSKQFSPTLPSYLFLHTIWNMQDFIKLSTIPFYIGIIIDGLQAPFFAQLISFFFPPSSELGKIIIYYYYFRMRKWEPREITRNIQIHDILTAEQKWEGGMTLSPWIVGFSEDLYLGRGTGNQSVNPSNNVSKYWWIKVRDNN